MIGNVVGNYKVVEKIGEGGMGAVYKGVDLMLEREVAIKVLKPELASQPQVVERFRSEAVTLAKLNHPNIATLFNFFRQGDYFFMVMEYVNGTPLDKIIEAHGVMTCEQAIPLFCQMLEGIDHAHAFGIVHRDIKPGNMMLTENGLLKVLDFGIARALGTARMTRAGHLIGTIEYMSPEQVRGMETDARSDIYSLGMVLYEMLTGRVPFASDSEFELMRAQVEQLPTPPREFAPNIPEQVEWAILCATEKDPEKRFQTAGAFGDAIVDSVNTAIATGALSQIDLRRATSRLSSSFAVSRDFQTSPNAHNSVPESATGDSERSAAGYGSPDTQRVSPATRLAGNPDVVVSSTPASPLLKETRLGDINYAASGAHLDIAPPAVSAAAGLSRKHYVAGGILAGILVLGLVVWAGSLLLRPSRASEERGSTAAPANTSDLGPQHSSTQFEEPAAPTALGPGDSSVGNSPKHDLGTLPDLDASSKSASTRKIAKPRNDAAARAREQAAREALNHKDHQ